MGAELKRPSRANGSKAERWFNVDGRRGSESMAGCVDFKEFRKIQMS